MGGQRSDDTLQVVCVFQCARRGLPGEREREREGRDARRGMRFRASLPLAIPVTPVHTHAGDPRCVDGWDEVGEALHTNRKPVQGRNSLSVDGSRVFFAVITPVA
jgi:hypothetical protein